MKKLTRYALFFALSFAAVSCDKEDDSPKPPVATDNRPTFVTSEANNVVTVEGSTEKDVTFSASKKYLLKGFVYVKSGATLTIEPGTIIKGDKDSKGTLIIEKGAKIMAAGTEQKPIVFTSNMPK